MEHTDEPDMKVNSTHVMLTVGLPLALMISGSEYWGCRESIKTIIVTRLENSWRSKMTTRLFEELTCGHFGPVVFREKHHIDRRQFASYIRENYTLQTVRHVSTNSCNAAVGHV